VLQPESQCSADESTFSGSGEATAEALAGITDTAGAATAGGMLTRAGRQYSHVLQK